MNNWRVVRWMVWEGDVEPSGGIICQSTEEVARSVYKRYDDAGEEVELIYHPPLVQPPDEIVATTRRPAALNQVDRAEPDDRKGP